MLSQIDLKSTHGLIHLVSKDRFALYLRSCLQDTQIKDEDQQGEMCNTTPRNSFCLEVVVGVTLFRRDLYIVILKSDFSWPGRWRERQMATRSERSPMRSSGSWTGSRISPLTNEKPLITNQEEA
jgi:hypothetical protein